MKKAILFVLIFFSFSVSALSRSGEIISKVRKCNIYVIQEDEKEIDRVEYIIIADQWYQIIYYTNGEIGIYQISNPPNL